MLYNQVWDNRPKVVSVWDGFYSWLKRQPSNVVYEYADPKNCLIAQYLKAQGKRGVSVGAFSCSYKEKGWFKSRRHESIPYHINYAAMRGKTYGGALAHLTAHS